MTWQGVVFIAVVVLVLGLIVWVGWLVRDLKIAVDVHLRDEVADVDPALFHALSRLKPLNLTASRGDYLLEEDGLSGGGILVLCLLAVLCFPVGTVVAVILLFGQRKRGVRLSLFPAPGGGSVLRASGVIQAHRWRQVSAAVGSVARVRSQSPGAQSRLRR